MSEFENIKKALDDDESFKTLSESQRLKIFSVIDSAEKSYFKRIILYCYICFFLIVLFIDAGLVLGMLSEISKVESIILNGSAILGGLGVLQKVKR